MIERILDDATAKAHAEAGEWQDCADRLNAIAEPTPITTLRGSGWLMTAMPNDAEAILAGFAAAQAAASVDGSPLAAYLHRIQRTNALLDTSGIDWSTASLQALLPVVASVASWSADLLAKVVAIGLPTPVVTSQECQDEWAQYLATTNQTDFDALWNEHASPVLSDRSALADALETIAAALRGA